MLRLFYCLFFIAIFSCTFIYGAEFPQCDNQPTESFVSVANNCSKFIYCDGVDSTILDCDKDSPYFSTEDQKCHNSTTVCGNRPFRLLNIPTTTPLSIPTTDASIVAITNELPATTTVVTSTAASTTVATTTETTELLKTTTSSNEQSLTTTLAPIQTATTTIATSMPTVLSTSITKTTAATSSAPNSAVGQCPVVDDPSRPLFLPHPKSCSQYYLCYHGVATLMKCPNRLHFDATHRTCNTPAAAKCQLNSLLPRENCQLHTVSFYPHPTNCNYYYLCEYGYLMVMQCPFKMHWDYKNKVCAMRSIAKCYNINAIYSY